VIVTNKPEFKNEAKNMPFSKILLVEDNPRYANAAIQQLRPKVNYVVLVRDYSEAIDSSTNPDLDGMIIDCFFPYKTGSGETDLGRELVGRMAKSDPNEVRIQEGLKALGQLVDLEDPVAQKYARFVADLYYKPDNVVFRALEQVAKLDRQTATHAFKETFKLTYREDRDPKDYYSSLMKAMEESEANQPLGILVAERADGMIGLPFILTTSTYHHDILTQPIQNYASRKGWRLVDCGPNREDDKASPEFWERALRELSEAKEARERRIKSGRDWPPTYGPGSLLFGSPYDIQG